MHTHCIHPPTHTAIKSYQQLLSAIHTTHTFGHSLFGRFSLNRAAFSGFPSICITPPSPLVDPYGFL